MLLNQRIHGLYPRVGPLGKVKKLVICGIRKKCNISKIRYFKQFPQKLQLMIGFIQIQAFTFIVLPL
jgi:hypothetical protein